VRRLVARAGDEYRTLKEGFWAQQTEFYIYRLLRVVPVMHRALYKLFIVDLRRLNDTLAGSPLEDHYWVWGGLLLGWEREGKVLFHDDMDADFAVLESDWSLLVENVPALEAAGFRGVRRFRNLGGQVTEITFMRHGARFEFFRLEPVDAMARYFVYGRHGRENEEIEREIPRQETEKFTFLGKVWHKVKDHERELAFIYGDWRIPDPNWSYMETTGDVVARRPWDPATSRW